MKKLSNLRTGTKITITLSLAMALVLTAFGVYTIQRQKTNLLNDGDTRMFEQVEDLTALVDQQIKENQRMVSREGEMSYELFLNEGEVYLSDEEYFSVSAINQE
ncbi:MAG: hypothetical protein ACOCUP_02945, partial [bacterium]